MHPAPVPASPLKKRLKTAKKRLKTTKNAQKRPQNGILWQKSSKIG